MGGYYQNHVNSNIILLGCNHYCLFLEHGVSYFMFNKIMDEAMVNDGIGFVTSPQPLLLSDFFLVPPSCTKTPFTYPTIVF